MTIYTYAYVEYGSNLDEFPCLSEHIWKEKQQAIKAMEEQAKVNCSDSGYWYDIVGIDKAKIVIYDDDNNVVMKMKEVSITVPATEFDKSTSDSLLSSICECKFPLFLKYSDNYLYETHC